MQDELKSMGNYPGATNERDLGEGMKRCLASLGLDPAEGTQVPDYDGTIKEFNEGDLVTGTVVKVDKEEVLVDIGYKSEGVIPARELSIRYDVKPSDVVSPGDQLEALVLQKEDKEGRLILSKKRAQYERAWGNIEKIKEQDGVVEGEVIEVVKGGLILDIGLRGFLPASLIEMRRVRDLHQYIGQRLEAKIIELDRNRNNVVLSRRSFLENQKASERKELLLSLEKGSIRKGCVSSIVNFGVFVDLGGVDGLVHISEISWTHIDHPSEILKIGDEVEVMVLDVDVERERVSLSMKKAQEDPWEKLARMNPPGSIVSGKVTKIVPFGAFVELAPGVEGLVHISEVSWSRVEAPEEVLSIGDEIDVRIIDIDLQRRRISLSKKQVTSPEEVPVESEKELVNEPELVEADEISEKGSYGAEDVMVSQSGDEQMEIMSAAAEIAAEYNEIQIEISPLPDGHSGNSGDEKAEAEHRFNERVSLSETEQREPATSEKDTSHVKESEPDVEHRNEDAASALDQNPPEEKSLESILADMKNKEDA